VVWGIEEDPHFGPTSSATSALHEIKLLRMKQAGWAAVLMASVAMMALAGHLQFLAFGLLAIALFGGCLCIRVVTTSRRLDVVLITHESPTNVSSRKTLSRGPMVWLPGLIPFIRFVIAVAVGLCIAAPQLVPVLEFGKQSHRRSPPTAEGYAAYVSSAIKPYEWAGLEFPKMLGDPSASSGGPVNLSLFWAAFVKRGNSFGECALGLGPLVLLLLFWLRKSDWKRAGPLTGTGILGILIACGTPFDYLLYYGIPGWSSTGSPGRAIVLFVLSACCLAGLAIHKPEEANTRNLVKGIGLFVAFSVLLFVASWFLIGGVQTFVPGLDLTPFIEQSRAMNLPFFVIAMIISIGVAAAWAYRGSRVKPALLIAAPLVPMLLSVGVLRFGTPITPASAPQSMERVAQYNSQWSLFVTPFEFLPPNMATLLRIHDVAGYDSLLDRDTKAMLDAANKQDSSPPENGNMMFVKTTADPSALAMLGVSEINRRDRAAKATRIEGGSRVSSTGGAATIRAETYRSIVVEATGPGLLTLRDRNMPGWTAKVNGQRVPIKSGLFREIDLPPGSHVVEFSYWPPGLTLGLVLFLLGIVPFAMSVFQWRRSNTPGPAVISTGKIRRPLIE
jgi:hypothetical protein